MYECRTERVRHRAVVSKHLVTIFQMIRDVATERREMEDVVDVVDESFAEIGVAEIAVLMRGRPDIKITIFQMRDESSPE